MAILVTIKCSIWLHFGFLKAFGFYTLVQEPHCVHSIFFINFGLLLQMSVAPFCLFFLLLLLANLSLYAYLYKACGDSAKHCKK